MVIRLLFAGGHSISYISLTVSQSTRTHPRYQLEGLEPPRLFLPPAPLTHESNWPLLMVSKGIFEAGGLQQEKGMLQAPDAADINVAEAEAGGWGGDLDVAVGVGGQEE